MDHLATIRDVVKNTQMKDNSYQPSVKTPQLSPIAQCCVCFLFPSF